MIIDPKFEYLKLPIVPFNVDKNEGPLWLYFKFNVSSLPSDTPPGLNGPLGDLMKSFRSVHSEVLVRDTTKPVYISV